MNKIKPQHLDNTRPDNRYIIGFMKETIHLLIKIEDRIKRLETAHEHFFKTNKLNKDHILINKAWAYGENRFVEMIIKRSEILEIRNTRDYNTNFPHLNKVILKSGETLEVTEHFNELQEKVFGKGGENENKSP